MVMISFTSTFMCVTLSLLVVYNWFPVNKHAPLHCLGRGSASRNFSLTLDISADQSLLEDGKQAALGLLTFFGTDVDEAVDAGGCLRRCELLVT